MKTLPMILALKVTKLTFCSSLAPRIRRYLSQQTMEPSASPTATESRSYISLNGACLSPAELYRSRYPDLLDKKNSSAHVHLIVI